MKTHKLVAIFTLVLKVAFFLNIILGIALVAIVIHSSVSPSAYKNMIITPITNSYKLNYVSEKSYTQSSSDFGEMKTQSKGNYSFIDQGITTRIIVVFVMLVQLILALLVINELLKFTKGLKNPQLMFGKSTICFKRISIILGLAIILTFIIGLLPIEFKSINYSDATSEVISKMSSSKTYSFNINFELIFLLFVSLLLSVVFKEAEQLRSENELTI